MAYENKSNWTLGENKPNQTQNKPNSNPITEIPKMNVNSYSTKAYQNKPLRRRGQNKPNQTQNKAKTNPTCRGVALPALRSFSEGGSKAGYLSSVIRRPSPVLYPLSSVLRPLFPDEAAFSFDLAARPVILNANIRQLRLIMRSEQIGPFKARKETYHVY